MHTFMITEVQASNFNPSLIQKAYDTASTFADKIPNDVVMVLRDRDNDVYAWLCSGKIITLPCKEFMQTFDIAQAFGQALRDGKESFEFDLDGRELSMCDNVGYVG